MDNTNDTKYCKWCAEKIAIDAIICPKCGRQVESFPQKEQQPVIINNSASAASSASASGFMPVRRKKHYSLLLDILLIFFTGGLWIIWMILRPKYEY